MTTPIAQGPCGLPGSAAGDNEARCDCQATTATPKFVGKPKCEKCGCPGVLNTANADGGKSSEWRCWGWQCRHKWETANAKVSGVPPQD